MSSTESEDEDLKRAIALSMVDHTPQNPDEYANKAPTGTVSSTLCEGGMPSIADNTAKSNISGLAGLDRKAMEKERIARLASRKRERSISPPPLSRKAPKPSPGAVVPVSSTSRSSTKLSARPGPGTLQYPRGTVKRTWAFGYDRTGTDIKIEEVLERNTLQKAVLSAFQWDTEWVFSKLDFPRTKLVFVMQGKTRDERETMLAQTADIRHSLDLCFPSMEGNVNCMHSKLMLLFHEHKLRVAVPSANLLDFDWGETRTMENSVFLIDLPRLKPQAVATLQKNLTPFAKELFYFVEKCGLRQNVIDGLLLHDWSATQGMAFVHSVGGGHLGSDAGRTGFLGLSKAVKDLGLTTSRDLNVDFCASSIGSLNEDYLRTIHAAARGQFEIKSTSTQIPSVPQIGMKDRFKVYFPSIDTVKASNGGMVNGGTVCLAKNWWYGDRFPRGAFREYKSTRTGLLSHNKILYARGVQTDTNGKEKPIAWAYVGSSNMSESAWGKMTFDKKGKQVKIGCRNWECGVLLPVSDEVTRIHQDMHMSMDVFKDLIEIPFNYPADAYGEKEPWFFKDHGHMR